MKIVLDTNVLVSALLSPQGAPAKTLNLVTSGKILLLYDDRILEEYSEVLQRPRFEFDQEAIHQTLFFIEQEGEWVDSMPLDIQLPDPTDLSFLECAVSGNADALVTGNLKHFTKTAQKRVSILSPQNFLKKYTKRG